MDQLIRKVKSNFYFFIGYFYFYSFCKSYIIILENRGEFMFTIYVIFIVILVISFITGCIIQSLEHKHRKKGIKGKDKV